MRRENSRSSARNSYRSSTVSSAGTSSAVNTLPSICRTSSVRCGGNEKAVRRLTLTLIIIVVMYVTLFVPAELFNFFTEHVVNSRDLGAVYNTSLAFGNLLQAVNFAVNFVLYCAVNTHFRRTICRLTRCSHTTSPVQMSSLEANASTTVFAARLNTTACSSSSHGRIRSHQRPSGETPKEQYKHIDMYVLMEQSEQFS